MNKERAKELIRNTFETPFEKGEFVIFRKKESYEKFYNK